MVSWSIQPASLLKTVASHLTLTVISWIVQCSEDSVAKTEFRVIMLWTDIVCERCAHAIFNTVWNAPQLFTCRTPAIDLPKLLLMRVLRISLYTVKFIFNTNTSHKARHVAQSETLKHTNITQTEDNEKTQMGFPNFLEQNSNLFKKKQTKRIIDRKLKRKENVVWMEKGRLENWDEMIRDWDIDR